VDPRFPSAHDAARSERAPAALLGAIKTVEIALLGTGVAAGTGAPLGFLSPPATVAPGTVFYPARVVHQLLPER